MKIECNHFYGHAAVFNFKKIGTIFGNLREKEIDEVISSQLVGRIGCHADDITYAVPISYAYDGNCIYGHAREGMKISMMRKNPKVCFQTDHLDDMKNWKSVVAWGVFEELENTEERGEALKKLFRRNLPLISSETVQLSPHWPFEPDDVSGIEGVIYHVRLKEKTGRFEKSNSLAFFAS